MGLAEPNNGELWNNASGWEFCRRVLSPIVFFAEEDADSDSEGEEPFEAPDALKVPVGMEVVSLFSAPFRYKWKNSLFA